ncbi:hypothetical protein IFM89_004061 [Coptis chinensis]|uniref:Pentatricopeptide repeat-containing protein n=1 Tax=Coptis chinensis TaxID=261450 RepID=A0A835H1A3_9MAGN|nr:hypothetical protein IFM89_004061 [Coptis chinensis]
MYTCCGVTDVVKRFFDKMGEKDVVTWNIMITHLSKQDDDMELARKLFDETPERSVRSWSGLLQEAHEFIKTCLSRPMGLCGVPSLVDGGGKTRVARLRMYARLPDFISICLVVCLLLLPPIAAVGF